MDVRQILTRAILLLSVGLTALVAYKGYEHGNRGPLQQQSPPTYRPEAALQRPRSSASPLDQIRSSDIEADVKFLASSALAGRLIGEPGNTEAVAYIKKRYEELGFKVTLQPFNVGGKTAQNVIAWLPGENPNEIVVIGGHLDHIGTQKNLSRSKEAGVCLGADDNASGTAALLAVAKAYSEMKGRLKRTVSFQSYNAEEQGLKGSQYYCQNPVLPEGSPAINRHVLMVNLDMVGFLRGGEKYAVLSDALDNSIDITELVKVLTTKYPFASQVTNRGKNGGGSDHAPFYNKGVPVAFLHTGLHRWYHTPGDTADKLDYDGIEKISKYCYDLSLAVVQGEVRPTIKTSTFEPLPMTIDHGEGPDFESR